MQLSSKLSTFFLRYEKLIPILLFMLFLTVSIPGVHWGAPALWNPDELVWRVIKAVDGEMIFDETEPDFNYPSLPKYVMLGIGKLVYASGYGHTELIISTRVFSALLGGLAVVVTYFLAQTISGNPAVAALAGSLAIVSSVFPENARFAHNDMYLLLFTVLCIFFLVKYQYTKYRLWLYGSFLAVGLAASSKYTGGSLILIPLFTLLAINWRDIRTNWLQSLEMLFMGIGLSFLGYVIGTPKAFFWMAFYAKRVIPALQRYPIYSLQPNSIPGIVGQWAVFQQAVGVFIYVLFLLAFLWGVIKLVLWKLKRINLDEKQGQAILILLATLILFDLPFLVSVNYIQRYFIPFIPFFAVLAALAIKDLFRLAAIQQIPYAKTAISLTIAVGIIYSFLRLVSTALLFVNDARMPAGDYIATLQDKEKVIEYTLYPPRISRAQFYKARNYPIFFIKYPGQTVPTDKAFKYNEGEEGLIAREVDLLIVDSLTYARFSDEYICATNPVECHFFAELLAGETSLKLVKEFKYTLPPWLPQISIYALNPEVRIYEYAP